MKKTTEIIHPDFEKILAESIRQNVYEKRSLQSLDWYRKKVPANFQRFKIEDLKQTRPSVVRSIRPWDIGQIYTFQYLPKGKDTLPYYDIFPMVLIIGPAKGGFLGLNFHYLPPNIRAFFFSQLSKLVITDRTLDIEKIRVNYKILNAVAKLSAFRPTIKRYLINNIRRNFVQIYPKEWELSLFLPTTRFVNSTQEKVWKDSIAKIR